MCTGDGETQQGGEHSGAGRRQHLFAQGILDLFGQATEREVIGAALQLSAGDPGMPVSPRCNRSKLMLAISLPLRLMYMS